MSLFSPLNVFSVGAGTGDVTAMIRDPQGRQNVVEVMMEDKGDSMYRCTYRPTQAGPHSVTVTFGGVGIPKSPFNVDVGPGEQSQLHHIIKLFKWTHKHGNHNTSHRPTCVFSLWFVQPACRGRAGRRVVVSSRRG